MKQKHISKILALILFLCISFFFGDEYLDFQSQKSERSEQLEQTVKQAENFKLNDIEVLENTEFYYTPYMLLNEQLVAEIDTAMEKVWLEVYMFTETRIFDALKRANARGVDTKVILERYPYMAATINEQRFSELLEAGIEVVWSDISDYKLNHTKLLIIDEKSYISTGNMTYSTFKHNRDFFIASGDASLNSVLEDIFLADFAGNEKSPYHPNLVLSPTYSRTKIQELLLSAETSIKIYMQYFYDDEINELLTTLKKEKNINITVLVDKKNFDSEEVQELIQLGIDIRTIKKKIHAKAILVDGSYLFVGSVNFSNSSLDHNREVGVIVKNPEIIERFKNIFEHDKNSANILQE